MCRGPYLGYLGVQGTLSGATWVHRGPYLGIQGGTWAAVGQNLEFYHDKLGHLVQNAEL